VLDTLPYHKALKSERSAVLLESKQSIRVWLNCSVFHARLQRIMRVLRPRALLISTGGQNARWKPAAWRSNDRRDGLSLEIEKKKRTVVGWWEREGATAASTTLGWAHGRDEGLDAVTRVSFPAPYHPPPFTHTSLPSFSSSWAMADVHEVCSNWRSDGCGCGLIREAC